MYKPNLAILFWFYKEPEICINRLQLIKKHNPDIKIYGLYGGEQELAKDYENKLSSYLDDFYCSPIESSGYKWIHGDLIILEWFNARGRNLEWDSIAVVQWDMLVFDSLEKQFAGIKKDEIFISGVRPYDRKLERKWYWVQEGGKRKDYLEFKEYIKTNYDFTDNIICSLFIFEIFPKKFFEFYNTVKEKEVGMLEYKIPTYAKIFNFTFYNKDLGVEWFSKFPRKALNAKPREIQINFIRKQLKKVDGWRIFHPYFKIWE
jgi:hypothetical protein